MKICLFASSRFVHVSRSVEMFVIHARVILYATVLIEMSLKRSLMELYLFRIATLRWKTTSSPTKAEQGDFF